MKKYIFMIPSIINMGGAQMYVRNKVIWLKKQGWDVSVLSGCEGNILLNELKEYDCFISELLFCNYYFTKRKQRNVLDKLLRCAKCTGFSEIVIESTCISTTSWAEMLAKEARAKHVSFLLQEMNVVDNFQLQEFFKFKHQRRELVSITDQSLKMMFESFAPIKVEESYRLPAYCNNVVEDIDSHFLRSVDWHKYDYRVGCLSRIEKPFIMTAITNFVSFAQTHDDKRFLLFMIGGAPDNSAYADNIIKICANVKNVELIISGFMFPVPAKLLECFDAFFSSAGSCWACMRSGVPTISIDGNDFMPIGIMKHTTLHTLFRGENESALNYQEVFEDVIIKKKYPRMVPAHEIIEPDFSNHMEFFENTAKEQVYYNMDFRLCSKAEIKLRIMLSLIGAKNYSKLGELKNRLLHKTTSDR